ncbi:MAG: septal ring lytic transglycosylase RlpA family protein [Acidobacteriota bacterium]
MIEHRPGHASAAAPPSPASLRRSAAALAALGAALMLFAGCATNRFDRPRVGSVQRGVASWYGEPFHGRATASGAIYDMHLLTAAHRELPLGTVVDVTNLENGREVRVLVNDRGPFAKGRVLDLSYAAAQKIRMVGPGTAKVEIVIVELGGGPSGPNMSTRFAVQVGAFREAANARRLQAELSKDFENVRTLVDEGGVHRVRVGPFKKQVQADAVKRRLSRKGHRALVIALN